MRQDMYMEGRGGGGGRVLNFASFYTLFRGGFRGGGGGGGGVQGVRTPPFHMKNDVMHTVIYAAFCMLPSLDLQDCISF